MTYFLYIFIQIIREAKLKNIERLKRLKRITVLERNLLTPQ